MGIILHICFYYYNHTHIFHYCLHVDATVSTGNQINSEANVTAGRLANIYTESQEFITVKQQLDQKLNVARNEPVRRHPPYTTNFLWQVIILVCVLHDVSIGTS